MGSANSSAVGRLLDDLPEVHHGDPVGEEFHGRQVVGDEQAAEAAVALEVGEEVEDGRLDGDVEGRGRLVRDEQVGADGQRAGEGDPLALSAGEFVRMPVGVLGAQPDLGEEFADPAGDGVLGHEPVQPERFGDDPADGHPGVEGGRGVLEDEVEVRRAAGAGRAGRDG